MCIYLRVFYDPYHYNSYTNSYAKMLNATSFGGASKVVTQIANSRLHLDGRRRGAFYAGASHHWLVSC